MNTAEKPKSKVIDLAIDMMHPARFLTMVFCFVGIVGIGLALKVSMASAQPEVDKKPSSSAVLPYMPAPLLGGDRGPHLGDPAWLASSAATYPIPNDDGPILSLETVTTTPGAALKAAAAQLDAGTPTAKAYRVTIKVISSGQ